MCTVTFIPRGEGYLLAMNRDEKVTRGHAVPPSVLGTGRGHAIYPRDVDGGTWIAASDRGIALALLNSNDTRVLCGKRRSRGVLIPVLIGCTSSRNARATLNMLDLGGILPFRLVGIFADEKNICEWRWDQKSLDYEYRSWSARQWSSSSLSDAKATLHRKFEYSRAQQHEDAGSVAWLRRLHASHDPEHAHFSTCVHRGEVETLSYTEVICTPEIVQCGYVSGSPCRPVGGAHVTSFRRMTVPSASTCDSQEISPASEGAFYSSSSLA